MPEFSGIDFLKTQKNTSQVILVTSKENYALQSYEYDITDYIVKPLKLDRFIKAVQKAKNIYEHIITEKDLKKEIYVKEKSTLIKINVDEINWIEAKGDYAYINTFKKNYIIFSTMSGILKKLPSKSFLRVHRSFIVNLEKIKLIEFDIMSINDKLIPIGKSYHGALFNKLNLM